jgi:hypothetical protein
VLRQALAAALIVSALTPWRFSGQTALVPVVVTNRPSPVAGTLLVERDSMVRLMVLNEVTTKTARAGDRFALVVDEALTVDRVVIIPVGSKAWGEVITASESGAIGKAGKLSARLMYVETPAGRVSIRGESSGKGPGGAGATVLGVLGLCPLGLFTRGTNAKLKAGEIFNGYVVQELICDPATTALSEAQTAAPLVLAIPGDRRAAVRCYRVDAAAGAAGPYGRGGRGAANATRRHAYSDAILGRPQFPDQP